MSTPLLSLKEQLEAAQKAADRLDADAAKMAVESAWAQAAKERAPLVVPNTPLRNVRTREEYSQALDGELNEIISKGNEIRISNATRRAFEKKWKAQEEKGLPLVAPGAPDRRSRKKQACKP